MLMGPQNHEPVRHKIDDERDFKLRNFQNDYSLDYINNNNI